MRAFLFPTILLFSLVENSTDGSLLQKILIISGISSNRFQPGLVTGHGVLTPNFGYVPSFNIANIPKPVYGAWTLMRGKLLGQDFLWDICGESAIISE